MVQHMLILIASNIDHLTSDRIRRLFGKSTRPVSVCRFSFHYIWFIFLSTDMSRRRLTVSHQLNSQVSKRPNDAQVYLQETASTYLCKEWLQSQKFTILSKYTLSVSLYQPGMTLLEIICLIPSVQLSATDHKLNVVLPMVLRQIFVVKWKNCFSRRPLCKKIHLLRERCDFLLTTKEDEKNSPSSSKNCND